MSQPTERLSRRAFLIAVTGSALAAACQSAERLSPTVYTPDATANPLIHAPSPAQTLPPALPDANFGTLTYDKPILTDVANLFIAQYDYRNTPALDARTWSLRVDGLVESPMTFRLDELRAMPAISDVRTLECISNQTGGDLIGNLEWRGVPISEIVARVQPKAQATHVKLEAADGYTTSVATEWMLQPQTILAYELNGAPLTAAHGFPLRVHIPGLYGQKMPRWLTHIQFIDYDYRGYWESRGWSNVAAMRTKSIIHTPSENAVLQAGAQVVIQGIAVAGARRIVKVEVQIDDGEWMSAALVPSGATPLAWTQWYVMWTFPAPGVYRIGVRATDETGFVQQAESRRSFGAAFPSGTDAIHRRAIRAT
ncbi:MAG: molybdopterin-dependent oxidoreductase [Anaerolineae bacterium]|nr:molybdopterin-dependent oxidoreductase [Anaerolineae bacterium]